ncbi:hypothetical protein SBI_00002 [Streptomyces bingchenggensis BCW-1]|uniref:Uncharacterized protein n=1 Tax=Streptomyces bingchenggensis (strain BCW-1) TaxID=749414 RepID=D7BSU6_STRBB|nr:MULTISPECIES: hypothetical protein [Streptomyces]ADI03123.1 hypothetical protein SBI_00002 [Streptomyces bingchenggensis BCW-1]
MSYEYGGGPDWPIIRARRRAEEEASSARREDAAHKASAARWKTAFEVPADQVRAAVVQAGVEHRPDGKCGRPSCWDAVITRLAGEAEGGGSAAGGPDSGFTFSFGDLFGRPGPQGRP